MHYLFARTNDETNIKGPYFLSTSRYFQLFSRYGNPCYIIYKYKYKYIRNKISFLSSIGIWTCSWCVIKSAITPFGRYRIWSRDKLHVHIPMLLKKWYFIFYIFIFILIYDNTWVFADLSNHLSTRIMVLWYSSHH